MVKKKEENGVVNSGIRQRVELKNYHHLNESKCDQIKWNKSNSKPITLGTSH